MRSAPTRCTAPTSLIDMTTTAAEARGDMLINGGVVAKASWQHVFGAPADKQPPLRISAMLDNSYRNQLGLDINDMVQGDVGVEVTVARDRAAASAACTCAPTCSTPTWCSTASPGASPRARASVFEFDVVKGGTTYPTELHERQAGRRRRRHRRLDGDRRRQQAEGVPLPQLLAQRRHQPRDARQGAPGRRLGRDAPRVPPTTAAISSAPSSTSAHLGDQSAKVRPGLDLRAEVDTVVGYSDTTLRNVKM